MWALGAFLSIIGSVASNFGVNLQKYSFLKNAQKPKLQQQHYYKQKLWGIGLALVIGGSIGDFAALSMAAQSIVAPLGSVTLVTNMVFAKYFLKEILRKTDAMGTCGIILGSVLAVAFGNHDEVEYTVQQLLSFYGHPSFIFFSVISGLLAIAGTLFARHVNPLKTRLNDAYIKYDAMVAVIDGHVPNGSGSATSAGLQALPHAAVDSDAPATTISPAILAVAQELPADLTEDDITYQHSIIESLEQQYKRYEKWHPFILCSISGIFGGWSVLFGKAVAELLSTTFQGDSQLGSPIFWLFAVFMGATIFAQLRFLAFGLLFFDALYCVPIFQCFWIMTSTLGGGFYYGEFGTFSTLQWFMFPIGIGITVGGVFVLSKRKMNVRTNEARVDKHASEIELGNAKQLEDVREEGDESELYTNAQSDESDADDDDPSLTAEQKLRRKIERIQRHAQYAAEQLDGPSQPHPALSLLNGSHAVTIDIQQGVSTANQAHNEMQRKLAALQKGSSEQIPVAVTAGSTISFADSSLNNISPIHKPASPNRRVSPHRRQLSGSPHHSRRNSAFDTAAMTAGLNDSPIHRALAILSSPVAAAMAGSMHSTDSPLESASYTPPTTAQMTPRGTNRRSSRSNTIPAPASRPTTPNKANHSIPQKVVTPQFDDDMT